MYYVVLSLNKRQLNYSVKWDKSLDLWILYTNHYLTVLWKPDGLYIYIHIYIYIYIYTYTYTYIYIYIQIYIYCGRKKTFSSHNIYIALLLCIEHCLTKVKFLHLIYIYIYMYIYLSTYIYKSNNKLV